MNRYKIGSRFKDKKGSDEYISDEYILARVDWNKLCLINLTNGNRYTKPLEITDCTISEKDLKRLMCPFSDDFIGVDNPYNKILTVDELEEGKFYIRADEYNSSGRYWVVLDGKLYCEMPTLSHMTFKEIS